MTVQNANLDPSSIAGSVASAAQASLAAGLFLGRAIMPIAATALTVAAFAALLSGAKAYGDYYQGQQCEYDFYGNVRCYDVWCHMEGVCYPGFFGALNCHMEEVCNFY